MMMTTMMMIMRFNPDQRTLTCVLCFLSLPAAQSTTNYNNHDNDEDDEGDGDEEEEDEDDDDEDEEEYEKMSLAH